MLKPEDVKVISNVSKYDRKTREALATLIEVAYAAHKRGVLPNEAKPEPTFGDTLDYVENVLNPPVPKFINNPRRG